MPYLQLSANLSPLQPYRDILIAELADFGFESFEETTGGFHAWGQVELVNRDEVTHFLQGYTTDASLTFEWEELEDQNWNAEWERNFQPIELNSRAIIKAVFHQTDAYEYEFLISPKMAFGTGHHETTWLMSNALFTLDLANKSLLDMGCGTGILAVIAEKLGAKDILAVDIEEPAVENTLEHLQINQCTQIEVKLGGAEVPVGRTFDVILANINRNVLCRDLGHYAAYLKPGGSILLSGFFVTDIEIITQQANKVGLSLVSQSNKNNWSQLTFVK
ncbi:MAG TPA: 50S ribosomal protein L11 methyltransferase [Luteibaculaceae bacterium]|nr:50S ribosomal protein L11 methyltransferase [Luteibaculaceae bacterium]